MRFNRLLPAALIAGSLGLVACSDTDSTGPDISAFAGAWTATNVQYTAHEDSQRQLDIVPLGGGLSLTIDAGGDFSGTFTYPGEPQIPITGSVTLVGNNQADIVFNWPQGVTPPIDNFRATYNLQGDNLTFTRQETVFQFPGQPAPEAASLVIIMTR